MSDNQREMERREKRDKKDKRNKRIIWIIIAVIIVILAVMKICEININSMKNYFTDEDGNFTLTHGVADDNFPYNLDSSQNVSLVNINNKLGIITPSSFTVLNSKNAEIEYAFEHGYSNPVLETEGYYSLIYDQGSDNYRLDTTSKSVYEKETDGSIFCADVAKDGTVAYSTVSKEKLCDVTVVSRELKEKFNISTADGYVIAVALSDNGKKVAFACVTGENANLKTTVFVYDVKSAALRSTASLPQGVLIDMSFAGNNIITIGDTYAGLVKKDKYTDIYKQGEISTQAVAYTPSGDIILAYNSYNNSTDNIIAHIKQNGTVKAESTVSGNIKSVTASSSLATVLTNSEIISFNLSNGEEKEKLTVDDSVKSVCRMGNNIFVNRQSIVERSGAVTN